MKKVTFGILLALWAALTLGAWLLPPRTLSEAERRPLAQMPEVTAKGLLSGRFMEDFEKYSLDQFPLRQSFRGIKARVSRKLFRQKDMNGIYLWSGQAAKQEYPLNKTSADHALGLFETIYENHLQGAAGIYAAVVPDKNYYLAEPSGHLRMDYEVLFEKVEAGMPWAQFVDLTDTLTADSYYRTDAHWRQEALLPTARRLCAALGIPEPREEDFTPAVLDRPFYGVYCGQAALPLKPDTITLLESETLSACAVCDHETGKTMPVYDPAKLASRDLYDVYLSGAKSLLTIENPGASTDRELIVFRDSFGSSMVPLLVQGYRRITLVDIRYLKTSLLGDYLDADGRDVLFLYSTTVLNQSAALG